MQVEVSRVAVLQHTHTLRPMHIFRRAREQIERWSADNIGQSATAVALEHFVVLWVDYADDCHPLLGRLKAELESQHNLECVSSAAISESLQALSFLAVSGMRGVGPNTQGLRDDAHLLLNQSTRRKVSSAAIGEWAWNTCDGAYLWWFWNREQLGLPPFDWYWFLEWDTAWTGSLPRMLLTFHGVPPNRADEHGQRQALATHPNRHDLLGHAVMNTTRSYPHKLKLNRTVFSTPVFGTAWCSQQLMRMSHRLLQLVLRFSSHSENFMFCELRSPTVCALDPKCSMQPVQVPAPAFFGGGSRRDWNRGTFSNTGLQRMPRSHLANDSLPDQFYHRFKHDAFSLMESSTPSGHATPLEAAGVPPRPTLRGN